MGLRALLDNLLCSDIYKLMYNGKAEGLRVKIYSLETNEFLYYDFRSEFIKKDKSVVDYIKNNFSDFPTIKLVYNNGELLSKDELEGKIKIQEVTDEEIAIAVTLKAIEAKKIKGGA